MNSTQKLTSLTTDKLWDYVAVQPETMAPAVKYKRLVSDDECLERTKQVVALLRHWWLLEESMLKSIEAEVVQWVPAPKQGSCMLLFLVRGALGNKDAEKSFWSLLNLMEKKNSEKAKGFEKVKDQQ